MPDYILPAILPREELCARLEFVSNDQDSLELNIQRAVEILRHSQRTVVLSGAGFSTPSGIPDFRSSEGGLWHQYDPYEVASLSAFRYYPARFYEWLHPLALKIHAALPNLAHLGLARLERYGYLHTIITQNIDNLHQRGGSQNVLEVHGSMRHMTCTRCFLNTSSDNFIKPYLEKKVIPICPGCSGVLKPDLILYGEQLPQKTWLQARQACGTCEVLIVAGSSLEVMPVAGLPMLALEAGASLIVINQAPTYIDGRAAVVFHADLAVIIPRLVDSLIAD